jgi:hypothetical protein
VQVQVEEGNGGGEGELVVAIGREGGWGCD